MARAASEVWIAKGKKLVRVHLKKDQPTDDELLALLLGRSGTLRAPCAKVGRKLLVGFSQEAYEQNLL